MYDAKCEITSGIYFTKPNGQFVNTSGKYIVNMRVNRKTSKELMGKNCFHKILQSNYVILDTGHTILDTSHTILDADKAIFHKRHMIDETSNLVAQIAHVVLQAIQTIMNGPDFLDYLILTSSYLSNLMSCITASVRCQ